MRRWPSYAEKLVIWDKLGYKPFPLQEPIHRSEAKVIQIVGAEGGGKSYVTSMEILARFPRCRLIYLVGQEFENTKREFQYLRDALLELGYADPGDISESKMPPWKITMKNGLEIVTVSVSKAGAKGIIAKGEQPDIINLCEAGIMSSGSVFNAAYRRISRSNGCVILSGTLQDDFGWYAELEDMLRGDNPYDGETFCLPAWANKAVYPGGENDPLILNLKKTLPEDEFSRTVEAKKMTSLASIFGKVFDPKVHMRHCPYTHGVPVTLAVDPGWFPSVYAVAVLQEHGNEVWQIDEIYENNMSHEQIIDMCKEKEWWVSVREVVGDVAMKQHNADRSAEEVWRAKTNLPWHGKRIRIQDGISRHRSMLFQKRLYHDKHKCPNTAMEYKMYRRRVDKDGNPISDDPMDTDNHLMKALAYYLVYRFGLADRPKIHREKRTDPWLRTMGVG